MPKRHFEGANLQKIMMFISLPFIWKMTSLLLISKVWLTYLHFSLLCFLSMFCTCLFIVCMLIATATKKKNYFKMPNGSLPCSSRIVRFIRRNIKGGSLPLAILLRSSNLHSRRQQNVVVFEIRNSWVLILALPITWVEWQWEKYLIFSTRHIARLIATKKVFLECLCNITHWPAEGGIQLMQLVDTYPLFSS